MAVSRLARQQIWAHYRQPLNTLRAPFSTVRHPPLHTNTTTRETTSRTPNKKTTHVAQSLQYRKDKRVPLETKRIEKQDLRCAVRRKRHIKTLHSTSSQPILTERRCCGSEKTNEKGTGSQPLKNHQPTLLHPAAAYQAVERNLVFRPV